MVTRYAAAFFVSTVGVLACSAPDFPPKDRLGDADETAKAPGTAATTQSASQPVQTCGDRVCSATESCLTCAQDCGACKCSEAPACTPALTPPAVVKPVPQFDVKFEPMPKEKIAMKLREALARGDAPARVLAAALAPAAADEHESVTRTRALFAANAPIAATVRAHLGAVGMGSPAAYRARFPVSVTPHTLMESPLPPIDCGPPQLNIRLAKITVHEEDDDFDNDIVYCSVSTDSPQGSELRVTPKTPNLDEGESHTFTAAEATIWGQSGPRAPGGDLMLKYHCFEADSANGYAGFIGALAKEGARYGRQIDSSGWTSNVSGSVASLLPLVLALDSDDNLFEAVQTIPAAEHLKLTNGGSWSVRKSGTHYYSDWDWTVHMEAFGCAVNGGGTAPSIQDAGAGG